MTEKDTSQIPNGLYCYEYVDGKQVSCPYWSKDPEEEEQCNGYCSYLELGDWEIDGLSLLWDQCKECGIKDDYDPFEDEVDENLKEITKIIDKLESEQEEADTRFDYTKSNEIQDKLDIIADEISEICDRMGCDEEE